MRRQRRAQARRLAVMAVAAVLLATVVASSLSGGDPRTDPRASFTFEVENDTVLVRHYGGDAIDGSRLAVESGERGRLGTFDGSDGVACLSNVTRVRRGTVCRVPDAAHERLYVVWEGPRNRSLILARRPADPGTTPTPASTGPRNATRTTAGTPGRSPGTTAPGGTPAGEPSTGTAISTRTGTSTATLTPPTTATPGSASTSAQTRTAGTSGTAAASG